MLSPHFVLLFCPTPDALHQPTHFFYIEVSPTLCHVKPFVTREKSICVHNLQRQISDYFVQEVAEIRAKHIKKEKVKQILADNDSSDSEDDSCLDDEQWYCEHLAQWSGRVTVTADVQQNPAKLKEFLETHFRH